MAKLRMAMVGGGPGAFIGPVHRIAAELDGEIELVAGVFSSDPEKSKIGGKNYNIVQARAYANLNEMLNQEKARDDGADFISIVTPNHHHHIAAEAALKAGFPVICDKPVTANLNDAIALRKSVQTSKLPFALTYTYTGYPLVREARARIANGEIGAVRKIIVEYLQGWLSEPVEQDSDNKQASWRTDPKRSGAGGCIGDIGVHALNLTEFVCGHQVSQLNADLAAVVDGRLVDDDCSVLMKMSDGARGVLLASQIAVGELNGLRLRVYGEKGGLDWRQESPNELKIYKQDGSMEIARTGGELSGAAAAASRLPGGHPEGYLEAFANIYRDFAATLRGRQAPHLQTIDDGVRGMAFIESSIDASANRKGWVDFNTETD